MPSYSSPLHILPLVGQEIGVSDWCIITPDMVSKFADATLDHQWIHLDEERAKRESPFGATVAHGFLTLSLLPYLMKSVVGFDGVKMGVNYGLNKVRFTSPVSVGKAVRLRATLQAAEHKAAPSPGIAQSLSLTWAVVMEAEGITKPVCVAESLSLLYF